MYTYKKGKIYTADGKVANRVLDIARKVSMPPENSLMEQRRRDVEINPMLGESFADMYKRLEKQTGGTPMMPEYAFEAVDQKIEALSGLLNNKNFEMPEKSREKMEKNLAEAIKYKDLALKNQA